MIWRRLGFGGLMVMLAGIGPVRAPAHARRLPAPAAPKTSARSIAAAPYRSAILVDAESGTVLFEKEAHRQAPPASMTKMMLMLLVAERVRDGGLRWDDPIQTSARASQMGGSQVYLKPGEVFSLAEMMQAITIHSANDASYAVAEALAGSSTACVHLMNERAKQLNMRDTLYRTVHGLPPDGGQQPDLSSAYDLATLARQLVTFTDILRWSSTKEAPFRQGTLTLTNSNRLVRETNWVDGLKTGYYREAGFNVTATAQRGGMRLIAVVIGAAQKKDCFGEAAGLLNTGFAEYHALAAVKQGDIVANDVAVKGGKPRFVRVIAGKSLNILARRGEKRSFTLQLALSGDVQAPLEAQAVVGEVVVREGDAVVGTVPALSGESSVEQTSLWDRLF